MDPSQYLLSFVALVFVICLMLGLSWIVRRTGLGGATPMTGERHLGMVEQFPLDSRRKLVLVRRDKTAHLLLLGPNGETVVESGIPLADARTTAEAAIRAVEGDKDAGDQAA